MSCARRLQHVGPFADRLAADDGEALQREGEAPGLPVKILVLEARRAHVAAGNLHPIAAARIGGAAGLDVARCRGAVVVPLAGDDGAVGRLGVARAGVAVAQVQPERAVVARHPVHVTEDAHQVAHPILERRLQAQLERLVGVIVWQVGAQTPIRRGCDGALH